MIFEVCAWESIERLTREGKQVSGSLLPLHEMRWMNLQRGLDIYWCYACNKPQRSHCFQI